LTIKIGPGRLAEPEALLIEKPQMLTLVAPKSVADPVVANKLHVATPPEDVHDEAGNEAAEA
jgi:hypothetical protein